MKSSGRSQLSTLNVSSVEGGAPGQHRWRDQLHRHIGQPARGSPEAPQFMG
jgi:hypothetical protein